MESLKRSRMFLYYKTLSMRITLFASLALAAMLASCTETPQYQGAAVDNDQNVLTGGPITGTTIQNLPVVVKETLKERVPHAEIASIIKTRQAHRAVYEISFIDGDTREIYVRDDGAVLPEPVRSTK